MSGNKSIAPSFETNPLQGSGLFKITGEGLVPNGQWMEFEDSYIALLSGYDAEDNANEMMMA